MASVQGNKYRRIRNEWKLVFFEFFDVINKIDVK